jgi:hypothetical protein
VNDRVLGQEAGVERNVRPERVRAGYNRERPTRGLTGRNQVVVEVIGQRVAVDPVHLRTVYGEQAELVPEVGVSGVC